MEAIMERRTMRGDSFEAVLTAVARLNIQALEKKTRIASSLGTTYPKHASAFRAIESEVIRQIFYILAGQSPTVDSWFTDGRASDRELREVSLVAE
jgi:hypothetical protein